MAGAVLAAAVADTVIALLAYAAGASRAFPPPMPANYLPLTAVGVLGGAVGWAALRRWARRPARVLRMLVPVVVVLSLVALASLLSGGSVPDTSGVAVAALCAMHLATSAVGVAVFRRALPLPTGRPGRGGRIDG